MRFRKLRIAWSVFWGLAAALLITFWARSYWWIDMVGCIRNTPLDTTFTTLLFDQGHFRFYRLSQPMSLNPSRKFPDGWGRETQKVRRRLEQRFFWVNEPNRFGFQFPLVTVWEIISPRFVGHEEYSKAD